jgi:hypothetical protein
MAIAHILTPIYMYICIFCRNQVDLLTAEKWADFDILYGSLTCRWYRWKIEVDLCLLTRTYLLKMVMFHLLWQFVCSILHPVASL